MRAPARYSIGMALGTSPPGGIALPSTLSRWGERVSSAVARQALGVLGCVGLLGLLSGLWIYATYNASALAAGREPLVSFFDAFGSGVLDWGQWAPFLPLTIRITRRLRFEQHGVARACASYGLAAASLSLGQLALYALASVAVRRMLYEQDPGWTGPGCCCWKTRGSEARRVRGPGLNRAESAPALYFRTSSALLPRW